VVPSDQAYFTSTLPPVTIDNFPGTVYGAALAAGYAGLYQLGGSGTAYLGQRNLAGGGNYGRD
jgi:hypothetical protein